MFDRPPANDWSDRRGDCTETGPGADSASTIFFTKGAADNRETAWNKKRSPEALHRACDDELPNSGSEAAPGRCRCENRNANDENTASAVAITQRAADEQHGGKEQRVRFDYPLDVGDVGAQLALQRRQGDIDDGTVNERHTRAEGRRGEHPTLRGLCTGRCP